MSEKNGVDLGAIDQAIVLQGNGIKVLRAEIRSEVRRLEQKVDEKIDALPSKIDTCHMSVVGHGIMLTEHDERLTKLERGHAEPVNG